MHAARGQKSPGLSLEHGEVRAEVAGTARKMTVDSLARRGVARAFVLDMAAVERIVATCLTRALARSSGPVHAEITAEARVELVSLARGTPPPGEPAERSAREELLERRLEKVTRALAEVEREVARLRAEASGDPGRPSVYACVQGLSADAPNFARKRALLETIFEENLTLRSGRRATG